MIPPEGVRRGFADALPPEHMLAVELLFALRSGVQRVDNALSRWLGDDALTPGRWQVLVVLWSADGPLAQRDIVEALMVSRATVSGLVDGLLHEGHVTVAHDSLDKRQVRVTLTKSGRQMTARLVRENSERLRQMFGNLADSDLSLLTVLLGRLVA